MRRRIADWPVQGLDDSYAASESLREGWARDSSRPPWSCTAVKLASCAMDAICPASREWKTPDALDVGLEGAE